MVKKLPPSLDTVSFYGNDNIGYLNQIGLLRLQVWQNTGFAMSTQIDPNGWFDAIDERSMHFAILKNKKVIASSRLTTYQTIQETSYPEWFTGLAKNPSPPIAFISRLVVDPEFQGQGLGDNLDARCIALARQQDAGSVLCDVPEYRISALQRRGFELINQPKFGITFPTVKWAVMLLTLA